MEHSEAEDETLSHWNRPSACRKQINTRKRVHKKLYLTCKRMCKILMGVSIPNSRGPGPGKQSQNGFVLLIKTMRLLGNNESKEDL
jgi:hypothetical protein